ncbi:MAG TPA: DUF2961 domain-containing protein [Polyangiales bacterium]|nr:DUF2961 domain-containing protein [Polyangiales bacterium]
MRDDRAQIRQARSDRSTLALGTLILLATASCSDDAKPPTDLGLADTRGLERLSDWRQLPSLATSLHYEQQTSRDRGTHDTTLPLSDHGNRDFNNFVCASTDASIGPHQATPLYFDEPKCAERYVQGVVLARFTGSGRMVRMWLGMISLVGPPTDEERLRIYVDDAPTPKLDTPLSAALDGTAGPELAPPFGAGSSRRMAWYFPIAFEHKLVVALDHVGDLDATFYQCDVVRDELEHGSRDVEARLITKATSQLTAAQPSEGTTLDDLESLQLDLRPGEARTLQVDGPATIHSFEVSVPESAFASLSQLTLQARWDGADEPAIAVTLRDLLGAGDTAPEGSSLALQSEHPGDDRLLALRLPMPFATRANLTLTNTSDTTTSITLRLRGEHNVPTAPFGHLHVQQHETKGPSDAPEHVAVQAIGRGRLVGICAYAQGHADPDADYQSDVLNFLEGDVRATLDGQLALDGTGSEEYADDVFYFLDAPHATAFAQAWDVTREPTSGHASFCRWHVLGTELDFDAEIQLTFERGGAANPSIADLHRTVAYLYLEP